MAAVAQKLGITAYAVSSALKRTNTPTRNKKQALQKYVRYNTCVVCGTKFRARSAWNSGGNLSRETCSPKCEFELRSAKSKEKWTEERKEKMSEMFTGRDTSGWNIPKRNQRPNWKGGSSSYTFRKIAFEDYEMSRVCEVCGSTENICIHHRDKNRENNSRENLMVVCKRCHTGAHATEGDCGWKLYNSRVNQNGVSL